DGRRVNAVALGFHEPGALSELSRDLATGELLYRLAAFDGAGGVTGLSGAVALAQSPDGNHLYVARPGIAGSRAPVIAVFGFDAVCPAAPMTTCRSAGSTLFKLRDQGDPRRRSLKLSWKRGDETLPAALGDPVSGDTSYALCAYDQSGGPDTL